MKYIKTYEKMLKFNDPRVINNPLNPLIDIFIELLTKLAEYDNFKGYKIKKYFTEDTVTIKYNIPSPRNFLGTNITLFEIKIFKLYNNNGYSFYTIEATKKYIFEDNFDSRKLIEDELMKIRNKYVNHYDNLYRGGRDKFTDEDLDDIIKDTKKIISDFELELNMNKYNL